MNRKEQKLLVETAALAGELMLSSGAETFRAEDTMTHILKKGTTARVTPVALTTSIMVTLEDIDKEPLSIIRRVPASSTNLSRIDYVNEISREFCNDEITLSEAYHALTHIKNNEYTSTIYNIAIVGVCVGFALFFGGGFKEIITAAVIGILQALIVTFSKKIKGDGFIMDALNCACMSFLCMFIKNSIFPNMNTDIVIISCIMPLVPGVAITNAVRDTLHGDYISGSARTLEAFLKAASIGIGVGIGMMLYRFI